tara:strand:+ start:2757 stop:3059 length:303 start_codon:yes stop_codon:yes gene_type:complete
MRLYLYMKKNYKKVLSVGLGASALWALAFIPWTSCSRHVPKQTAPSPGEEILFLKNEVHDLGSAVDTLSELNLKLTEENKVLKSMLVACMKRHMEDGEDD